MEPGTIIGEYRVDRLLGEGGMAAVYQVWNSGLQRNEALKLLTPHLAHDRAFVERFLQEARTAANLQHPHIATIFAVSPSDAPQPFFTMQLLPGGDLADLLAQQGKLGVSQALPLLEEMADALDYAHSQGVVHRDIKPANILLQTDAARKLHVKLVDFGIARAQESGKTRLTKAGMLMGTPEYMAPEQAGTTDPISGCTDQYALGIVAYEMFCGRPPFPHRPDTSPISVIMSHCNTPPPPPVSLTPELPAEVSAALLRALSKRPQERFGSCGEFVRALKGQAHSVALAVPASYASTPAPASVPAAPARSAPVSWMPIAAITLAAVLGIGLVLNRLNKSNETENGRDDDYPRKDSYAVPPVKPGPKPGTGQDGEPPKPLEPKQRDVPQNSNLADTPFSGKSIERTRNDSGAMVRPPTPPLPKMEVYDGSTDGFILDYPTGWTVERSGNRALKSVKFADPGGHANFRVDSSPENSSGSAMAAWHEMDSRFKRIHGSRYHLISLVTEALDGHDAATWTFVLQKPGEPNLKKIDIGAVAHGRGYALIFISPPDHFEEFENVFRMVRSSFHFSAINDSADPPVRSSRTETDDDAIQLASTKRLTVEDVAGKSNTTLTLMRNSLFARHGLIFKREDLRAYFSGPNWPSANTRDPAVAQDRMTRVEKQNADFLVKYQGFGKH